MPTPFNHLVMAEDVLADPGLSSAARETLESHRGAFLFGNTAPDVQVVSGQSREATHFFAIPRLDATPAQDNLFRIHPEISHPADLPAAQAAFMAGYLCHLAVDELWLDLIFGPYFAFGAEWGDWRQRLLYHNVLRTHLDQMDFARLDGTVESHLRQALPDRWLPFTDDRYLSQWRDEIADQLAPGAPSRTIEVFAGRMRMQPHELEALLEPEILAERVFRHLPQERVADFEAESRARMLAVVNHYF